jgi:hypothetical protein
LLFVFLRCACGCVWFEYAGGCDDDATDWCQEGMDEQLTLRWSTDAMVARAVGPLKKRRASVNCWLCVRARLRARVMVMLCRRDGE